MDNLLFKIEIQGLSEQVRELGRLKEELLNLKAREKELNDQRKAGAITIDSYSKQMGALGLKIKANQEETKALARETQAQATVFKGAEGSMVRLAAELANNREKYRALSGAERENIEIGGKLLTTIQAQDTQIKKLDATIGNHQRNVGNYPGLMGQMGASLTSNIPVLGSVTNAVQDMKGAFDASSSAAAGSGKGMALMAGAAGVALAAFGALSASMIGGIKDAMNEERSQTLLRFALNGNADATERMIRLKDQYKASTLFDEDEIMGAINMSLELGRTELQTKKMIEAAMGMSRVTGKDLNSSMMSLSATYEGQVGKLGKLASEVKGLTEEQLRSGEAVDILNKKFGKFATEGIDTMEGKVVQMKKLWQETWEGIGFKAMYVLTGIQTGFKATLAMMGGGITTGEIKAGKSEAAKSKQMADHQATMDQINAEIDANKQLLKVNTATQKENAPVDDKAKAAQEKAKAAAEKAQQDYEDSLKKRTDAIAKNNAYILELTRKAIDDEIAAMLDGAEKEKAISNDKLADSRTDILNKAAESTAAIDAEIKAIETKGKKATSAEKKQLEELKKQRLSIIEQTDAAVVALAIKNKAELAAIDKKFSKGEADKQVTDKYSADVAQVESDGKMKLDMLAAYYAAKGTLTKQELEKQKAEELKINMEIAQQKFNLLEAEIKARQKVGGATVGELQNDLNRLAALYAQVKELTGQSGAQSENTGKPEEKKNMFGGVDLGVDNIDEQKGAIIGKVKGLLDQIGNMYAAAQQQRIQAELKAEMNKVDKQYKNEVKSLDEQRKKGLLTEKQYNAKKEKLDEDTEKKKTALQKDAFEKEKRLKILMTIINGAAAAISMLANPGGIAGVILAGLALLSTGIEINTISQTKFEGAKGGLLRGNSHAQGGIKYQMGGDILELEGGEAVINKRAMESDEVMTVQGTPMQIASEVNSMNGWGDSFETGGEIKREKLTNTENITNRDTENITNIKTIQQANPISLNEGDAIINKRSMASADVLSLTGTPRDITSRLNTHKGYGRPFESGGFISRNVYKRFDAGGYTPVATPRSGNVKVDRGSVDQVFDDRLNSLKVYVVDSEMTEQQGKSKKIKVESEW